MGLSRRTVLARLGAAGGSGVLYSAMVGLGLLALPPAGHTAPKLAATHGAGRTPSSVPESGAAGKQKAVRRRLGPNAAIRAMTVPVAVHTGRSSPKLF